ncbi:MAG: hypothetical protein VYD70_07755 [Planctomycetota bacterium]|nr:hypothetical protein [Planctomycetota bacterium]
MLLNELKETSDAGHTRVVAPDYATAVRILQERFGSDWTVVHSRKVRRSGFFGWFGVSDVVVIVRNARSDSFDSVGGYEESVQRPGSPAVTTSGFTREVEDCYSTSVNDRSDCNDLLRHLEVARSQIASELQQFSNTTVIDRKPEEWQMDGGESADLESDSFENKEECDVEQSDEISATGAAGIDEPFDESIDPRFLGAIRSLLESSGIPAHAYSKIIGSVCEAPIDSNLSVTELQDIAYARVGACILDRIPDTAPIVAGSSSAPRIVALVGPTGVGKTTTLAKLASYFHLVEKKRVGLVTLDSYRIGAIEQLRRFAEILGLPLKTVVSPGAAKEAIDGFSDCDLILVDTAGRSQRDMERLAEVRDSLGNIDDIEVHLCLSLGAAPEAVIAAAESFCLIGYDRVIFTKRDESYRKGFLWDLFGLVPATVSYITCGQEVPEDIAEATRDGIKDMILGDQ